MRIHFLILGKILYVKTAAMIIIAQNRISLIIDKASKAMFATNNRTIKRTKTIKWLFFIDFQESFFHPHEGYPIPYFNLFMGEYIAVY